MLEDFCQQLGLEEHIHAVKMLEDFCQQLGLKSIFRVNAAIDIVNAVCDKSTHLLHWYAFLSRLHNTLSESQFSFQSEIHDWTRLFGSAI